MRWFFKPQSVTVRSLDSVDYCYVYSLSLPDLLIPSIYTTQVHLPTWAFHVSVPEYLTSTQGHSPTWASLVSVPAYRLPTHNSYPFWLRSYFMPIYPLLILLLLSSLESSRVAQSFSVASWRHHTFLLCPPPSYPVSIVHTSNKGRISTHCAEVACRFSM